MWIYVVIVAGAISVDVFFLGRYTSSKQSAKTPEQSIAVLPFENASNEPNTEYLSEGISEALINGLSELQQLRVIARPTAFRYNPTVSPMCCARTATRQAR
jgi:TolB-like protein